MIGEAKDENEYVYEYTEIISAIGCIKGLHSGGTWDKEL